MTEQRKPLQHHQRPDPKPQPTRKDWRRMLGWELVQLARDKQAR